MEQLSAARSGSMLATACSLGPGAALDAIGRGFELGGGGRRDRGGAERKVRLPFSADVGDAAHVLAGDAIDRFAKNSVASGGERHGGRRAAGAGRWRRSGGRA